MTAQSMETIYIDGRKHWMATEPFSQYLETFEVYPNLAPPDTACWRGYYGKWKIKDNKLFLNALEGYIEVNGKMEEIDLNYFFPNQKEVFASWYSGEVRIPMGKEIQYVHMGYESLYEKDLIIHIEDGVVERKIEKKN